MINQQVKLWAKRATHQNKDSQNWDHRYSDMTGSPILQKVV